MSARFKIDWLLHPDFKEWVEEVPSDSNKARCNKCHTIFSLSNMGQRALRSHANGAEHKKRITACKESLSIKHFIRQSAASTPSSTDSASVVEPACSTQSVVSTNSCCENSHPLLQKQQSTAQCSPNYSMKSFVVKENVCKAEILWCMHSVVAHKTMRSSGKDINLMKVMFPDSQIAQKMQLQRSKIAYSIAYGISPFFRNELISKVNECKHITVGFDESLNKVSQKTQMDLNVRFWDSAIKEVQTRYLTSAFLGRARADDIRAAFKSALSPLSLTTVLQISMDGPNVNHRFFKDLKAELDSGDNDPVILDMGSCGLHAVHGAFKAGIQCTEWELIPFLRSLYNLFKDVPARRAVYTEYSGSELFPLKFCSVRWLENGEVAQRAIVILPHIRKYLESVKSDRKQQSSTSFHTVSKLIEDPLLTARLAFFKFLSSEVEPFLREFQSDVPLAPFLYSALLSVMANVMEKFVKKSVLEKQPVHRVDVTCTVNLRDPREIALGYGTRSALKKSKASELAILQFRKDCQLCMKTFILKLLERSPLKSKITKAVSCFDPHVTVNTGVCSARLQNLLTILQDHRWIDGTMADSADREFKQVCLQPGVREELQNFSRTVRVDHFWRDLFARFGNPKSITEVMKMIVILSHGNANIERGFSVNSECLVENMKEESIVAQRCVYDSVMAAGGNLEKFEISKSLIHSYLNSHSRMKEETAKRQKEAMQKETEAVRKRRLQMETRALEAKIAKIKENAQNEVSCLEEQVKSLQDKLIG